MKRISPEPFFIELKGFVIFGMLLILTVIVGQLLIFVEFPSLETSSVHLNRLEPMEPISDFRLCLLGKRADINSISYEEFVMVPGIGEKTAQRILDFRQEQGFILDMDELLIPCGPVDSLLLSHMKIYFRQGFVRDSL